METISSSELEALVQKAQSGDLPNQELLIRHYQNRMAGFVYSFLGRPDLVEDLCQDIFIKILLGLPRMKNPAQFESWLFRIARNRCLDEIRKQKWRKIFIPWLSEYEELPAPPASRASKKIESLLQAIQTLPPSQRELIALIQDGDRSYEELAAMTSSTVSSVKSRLFRAREQLKEKLRDES